MIDPAFIPQLSLTRAERDRQLSPSLSAKDAAGALGAMVRATQAAKSDTRINARLDVRYGPRARQTLDVFRPADAAKALPCLVFIHGGFWQEGDKSVSGFAAQTFTSLGWSYVAVGYTLTPEISLKALMSEISAAAAFVQENATRLGVDPARIVVAGHSAGGHLAASLLTHLKGRDVALAGAVLVSGVYELAPIAASYVSDLTPMSAKDVAGLSPLRHPPPEKLPVHLLIGADEPDAFQVQTKVLRNRWAPNLPDLTCHIAPGRDHFDVLFELSDPRSPSVRAVLSMV